MHKSHNLRLSLTRLSRPTTCSVMIEESRKKDLLLITLTVCPVATTDDGTKIHHCKAHVSQAYLYPMADARASRSVTSRENALFQFQPQRCPPEGRYRNHHKRSTSQMKRPRSKDTVFRIRPITAVRNQCRQFGLPTMLFVFSNWLDNPRIVRDLIMSVCEDTTPEDNRDQRRTLRGKCG